MSEDLKEYIVTVKERSMLDDLYEDMESPGGDLYIPGRKVEIANRREISRNTHYYLTDSEAQSLRQDPRVLSVELSIKETNIGPIPLIEQYSDSWNKDFTSSSPYKNWGLLRCYGGMPISGWSSGNRSGSIDLDPIGRNVDVVIVDGHITASNNNYSSHLEFRSNADGSGNDRFVYYNWLQHTSGGTYVYSDFDQTDASNNNHGVHVGGIAAGNTQGWARGSNVYNISPYGSQQNTSVPGNEFDYIRYFHNAKSINSLTGYKTPTVVNCSYGYYSALTNSDVSSIVVRGSTVFSKASQGTLTLSQAQNFGLRTAQVSGSYFQIYLNARQTSLDVDVQDAMDDGIIVVGAAGNFDTFIDIPNGIDYNNYVEAYGYRYYYNRGMSPGSTVGVICVGAISESSNDSKADYSNYGPRIDVWAPGSYIMSSVRIGGVADPRNSNYRIGKMSGTSMASPQVCGVLACALEKYPSWNQADARSYLRRSSSVNDQATFVFDSTDHFLKYIVGRGEGTFFPGDLDGLRPIDKSTKLWPRPKIKR